MVTGLHPISDEDLGIFPFFNISDAHPLLRPGRDVVPIFAGHLTSRTTGAAGLIEIKTDLHKAFLVLFFSRLG
jgi:hypothetical protein